MNSDDDIRVAYQVAARLITYEGSLAWRTTSIFIQFATLLIAGASFPSLVGSLDPRLVASLGLLFSSAGFTASAMWWSMVLRSRRYYEYWILRAGELETLMDPRIRTFRDGLSFSKGNELKVGGSNIKFETIERIRMKSNISLFYGIFILAFLILGALNLYR